MRAGAGGLPADMADLVAALQRGPVDLVAAAEAGGKEEVVLAVAGDDEALEARPLATSSGSRHRGR